MLNAAKYFCFGTHFFHQFKWLILIFHWPTMAQHLGDTIKNVTLWITLEKRKQMENVSADRHMKRIIKSVESRKRVHLMRKADLAQT